MNHYISDVKKTYLIKDKVWIHIGSSNLIEGRIVKIVDLEDLNEGYSRENKLYIIEVNNAIEPFYEVRSYDQISIDPKGPINLYKETAKETAVTNQLLKKVGMALPESALEFSETNPPPFKKKQFKRKFYKRKK